VDTAGSPARPTSVAVPGTVFTRRAHGEGLTRPGTAPPPVPIDVRAKSE
jgi:hypothetical protein